MDASQFPSPLAWRYRFCFGAAGLQFVGRQAIEFNRGLSSPTAASFAMARTPLSATQASGAISKERRKKLEPQSSREPLVYRFIKTFPLGFVCRYTESWQVNLAVPT